MPHLIAQGAQGRDRWRRRMPIQTPIVLGRESGTWSVKWDGLVSRKHVHVIWDGGRMEVTTLPDARNPVFYRGTEESHFFLELGEHFVIGNTTFSLADDKVDLSVELPHPVSQKTFSAGFLKQLKFRKADQTRLDVLASLPELMSGSISDDELFVRLVNVVLSGVSDAVACAIVSWGEASDDSQPVRSAIDDTAPRPMHVIHWDLRDLRRDLFTPSERLIQEALSTGESILHVWEETAGREQFTQMDNTDWAFCVPATAAGSEWGVYVAGKFAGGNTGSSDAEASLDDDVKFTGLATTTIANLRTLRHLEHNHASLSQFFSPLVLDALAEQDPAVVLAPRETEVSVLFCDLRGFSRSTERSADDLLGQLDRVSRALGVMTRQILEQGGVIGDFHGDAAMGFWGWPFPQSDSAWRACQAALAIRSQFLEASSVAEHPLAGFQVGIGIATGRAVAGKLGSIDQVKVTVFGPVVNLAARLEGMTTSLRAPILLDEATARQIRVAIEQQTDREMRVRRVARVRPYGLESALEVSELLPSQTDYPHLTDDHIASYEQALDALCSNDWESAFQYLHEVPAEDRVKDFLTVYIAQHNRTPPENWDGAIALTSK